MINFYNQVPSVYTSASRDFQYLSWLINIVLNSVKHNVDDMYDLPNTKADPRLTELLAMTLGFKVKRKYDQDQLATIVSILPSILKCKGTREAVELVAKALIATAGSVGTFKCEMKNNCLVVVLPKELIDTTLFMDLMPYILPAGVTCRVVRATQVDAAVKPTEVTYENVLRAAWHQDLSWNGDSGAINSTGSLHTPNNTPNFAFNTDGTDGLKPNVGLLDNSVIPVINTMKDSNDYSSFKGEQL